MTNQNTKNRAVYCNGFSVSALSFSSNPTKESILEDSNEIINDVIEVKFDYKSLGLSSADEDFLKTKESIIGTRSYHTMIANGLDLIEAKARVGHGAFTKWVEECLGVSARRAQEYMRIADTFKSANIAHLEKLQKTAMI